MSIRLAIRDQAIAELNALGKPEDIPKVTKRRWIPSESDKDLSMAVVFINEPVEPKPNRGFPLSKRGLLLGVECVGSTTKPELSDDIIEPLLTWAVSVLGDTNLAGLAHSIEEEETIWETAVADRFYIRATIKFRISYQTKRNDLDAKQ